MTKRTSELVLLMVLAAVAMGGTRQPGGVERLSDGILLPVDGGFLRLQVKGDSIVRVLFSKVRDPHVDEMVVTERSATPKWTLQTGTAGATLTTARLRATVNVADGSVAFADSTGRPILAEAPGSRRMTSVEVQGERTYNVQQAWQANRDESLYGLGQRQEGKLDIKGYDFDLWQRNTVVAIPFLVSSRGYGILWDNTSFTKFGDVRPFEPIPLAVSPPGAEGAGEHG